MSERVSPMARCAGPPLHDPGAWPVLLTDLELGHVLRLDLDGRGDLRDQVEVVRSIDTLVAGGWTPLRIGRCRRWLRSAVLERLEAEARAASSEKDPCIPRRAEVDSLIVTTAMDTTK